MKKLTFLFLISISILSCSVSDDSPNFTTEFLPIESAQLPDSFELNETYEIIVSYYRPSTCHSFNNFYYRRHENERTVAIINNVIESESCEDLIDELVEVTLDFIAIYDQTYVFKFWQGLDENDEDLYYIVEVPVID
jgi:hypothetical protein